MGRGPGVRATGAQSIQIDFRWKGVRCRERLRLPPTPANLKFAKRLKASIEHAIATGTFDYAEYFPDSPRATALHGKRGPKLRAALLAYVGSLDGQLQPETIKEYMHHSEIVAAGLGNPYLTDLDRAAIRDWVSKQALSKNRIDNLLSPLRGMLRQALEDETIKINPLDGFEVRRIAAPKEIIDPFTPQEIEALGKGRSGDLWTFWAWTGLRSGEIIGLRRSDVAIDMQSISIKRAVRIGREKSPKTASGTRVLHLLPPAKDALRNLGAPWNDDGPVFINPRTGGNWHEAKALNREFTRACKETGVRIRYVYQLRHTFATWALSSGENPAWIAKQMGHTDTTMLYQHYGKWMPQMDPKAGSRMLAATKSKAKNGQRAA